MNKDIVVVSSVDEAPVKSFIVSGDMVGLQSERTKYSWHNVKKEQAKIMGVVVGVM